VRRTDVSLTWERRNPVAMNHLITLSLVDNLLHTDPPNPLEIQQPISPGDTITWIFDDSVGGEDLRVVFKGLRDLTPTPGLSRDVADGRGPFENLSPLKERRIEGTFRPDLIERERTTRFFYRVIRDGVALEWEDPVELNDTTNGGGIDIPGKPPGM
jgi:hypothetical protein